MMLFTFTVNGQFLASVNTKEILQVLFVSRSGDYVVTGGNNGTLIFRTLHE
jgi:hypothetical protein